MRDIITAYKDIVVQINTPTSSGSGLIVKDQGIIVTNRHVIFGNDEVVVRGEYFKKRLAEVIYTDALNDLAFLKLPEEYDCTTQVEIAQTEVEAGEAIIAIGHPLGLRFTATKGIVSKAERRFNNVDYIQVDAAINPGNSGGPLINEDGQVVGVNTFIYRNGESLGFALPSTKLQSIINEYSEKGGIERASMCVSCTNIVTRKAILDGYCPHCGNKFDLKEFDADDYQPGGVSFTIESILKAIGKDVKLARVGKAGWEVEEGSALVRINYNGKDGFIYADATLGTLPKENIGALYSYLLRENYKLDNLTFSVDKQNIMLSTIIYDHDLNAETGQLILSELFKKADEYDDLLHDEYGVQMTGHY